VAVGGGGSSDDPMGFKVGAAGVPQVNWQAFSIQSVVVTPT